MTNRKTVLGALAATLVLSGAAFAQSTPGTSMPGGSTTQTTITTEQQGKIRTYVMKEKKPSVRVTEQVTVGGTLPASTELYAFPEDVGVRNYRYSVVNDRTVIVDPSTRRIIQVIE